jgi:hypothetical protein
MVQINKREVGPVIPYAAGRAGQCRLANAATRLVEKYNDDPDDFINPRKQWRPNQQLYGHDILKTRLKVQVQNNKCCYCEKEIRSNYTVEHYRPCSAVSQESEADRSKPGYFWLSYDWKNLFYSCHECNGAKGTLFPLGNPHSRASVDVDSECELEQPLLTDMVSEDPKTIIEYIYIEPVGTEEYFDKGELMIKTVGLRSENMFDERLSHWQKVKKTKIRIQEKIAEMAIGPDRTEEINWYNSYLDEKCDARFPFSSLISCNRDYFELEI